MYNFFAVLIGCIIASQVAVNGVLSAAWGVFSSTVVVHAVGSLFALLLLILRRQRFDLKQGLPLWMFSGGLIGLFTVLFNSFAFEHISMTSIVALCLLGQTLTSLLIDNFGLLGMEKQPLPRVKWIGLGFAAAGIAVMLGDSKSGALLSILFALLTGVTTVISRTVNARLADRIGALPGSLVNHLVGLPCSVLALLLLGWGEPTLHSALVAAPWWSYCGGMLGVMIVLLFNLTVPHTKAVDLTLLSFVGQVFTGVLIDLLARSGASLLTFAGGLLVACGLLFNTIYDKKAGQKLNIS